MEERALSSERKVGLLEARVSALEGSLAQAQEALKATQTRSNKELAAARQEVSPRWSLKLVLETRPYLNPGHKPKP